MFHSPSIKRLAVVSAIAAIIGLTGIAVYRLAPPARIQQQIENTTIDITASPATRLYTEQCVSLSWTLEQIAAIYVNDLGRVGQESVVLCDTEAADFLIQLPDGQMLNFLLSPARLSSYWQLYPLLFLYILFASIFCGLIRFASLLAETRFTIDLIKKRCNDLLYREDRWHVVLLVIVLLTGFAVRFVYANIPFGADEGRVFLIFSEESVPLSNSLSNYQEPGNHLLNTLLTAISARVFGSMEEWSIRLPNMLVGFLLVPLTYIAGRQLYGRESGLYAAILVATFSPMVMHTINARGHIYVAVATIALIVIILCVQKRNNDLLWLCYILVAVAGAYAVPTILYPLAFVTVWAFLTFLVAGKRQQMIQLMLANIFVVLLTLLVYTPVFVRFGVESITSNTITAPLTVERSIAGIEALIRNTDRRWFIDVGLWVRIMLLFGFAAGILLHKWIAKHAIPIVIVMLPTILIIILWQKVDVQNYDRVFLFIFPIFVMTSCAFWVTLVHKILQLLKQKPDILKWVHSLMVSSLLIGLVFVLTQSMIKNYADQIWMIPEARELADDLTAYGFGTQDEITAVPPPYIYGFIFYPYRLGQIPETVGESQFYRYPRLMTSSSLRPETRRLFVIYMLKAREEFPDNASEVNLETYLDTISANNNVDIAFYRLLEEYPYSALYVVEFAR